MLLPFFAGEGEKSWKRRPIAVVTILLIAVALGHLHAPGQLFAVESRSWMPGAAIRFRWKFLNGRTPLERQGALVFQEKQCRNCHSLGGSAACAALLSIASPRA